MRRPSMSASCATKSNTCGSGWRRRTRRSRRRRRRTPNWGTGSRWSSLSCSRRSGRCGTIRDGRSGPTRSLCLSGPISILRRVTRGFDCMGEYAPKAIKDAYPIIAKAFKSASNGGIVSGGSYGYHVSRNRLKQLDKKGDGDACSALDVLLSDKDMKIATRRLLDAAKRKDPRVYKKLREFGGTLDGKTVTAYNVTEQRYISMDKSHLWHVHLSGHRK